MKIDSTVFLLSCIAIRMIVQGFCQVPRIRRNPLKRAWCAIAPTEVPLVPTLRKAIVCSVCRGEGAPDFADRCHKFTHMADSIVLDDRPMPGTLCMSARHTSTGASSGPHLVVTTTKTPAHLSNLVETAADWQLAAVVSGTERNEQMGGGAGVTEREGGDGNTGGGGSGRDRIGKHENGDCGNDRAKRRRGSNPAWQAMVLKLQDKRGVECQRRA